LIGDAIKIKEPEQYASVFLFRLYEQGKVIPNVAITNLMELFTTTAKAEIVFKDRSLLCTTQGWTRESFGPSALERGGWIPSRPVCRTGRFTEIGRQGPMEKK